MNSGFGSSFGKPPSFPGLNYAPPRIVLAGVLTEAQFGLLSVTINSLFPFDVDKFIQEFNSVEPPRTPEEVGELFNAFIQGILCESSPQIQAFAKKLLSLLKYSYARLETSRKEEAETTPKEEPNENGGTTRGMLQDAQFGLFILTTTEPEHFFSFKTLFKDFNGIGPTRTREEVADLYKAFLHGMTCTSTPRKLEKAKEILVVLKSRSLA